MWGHAFFGAAFFGAAYFGPSGGATVVEDAVLSAASTSSGPILSATITGDTMRDSLAVGSTNDIVLMGLKRREPDGTRVYLDDATVELTALFDSAGAPVVGTQNIAMPYLGGVGRKIRYGSVLPHTVPLVPGEPYKRRYTATDSDGNVIVFDKTLIAEAAEAG